MSANKTNQERKRRKKKKKKKEEEEEEERKKERGGGWGGGRPPQFIFFQFFLAISDIFWPFKKTPFLSSSTRNQAENVTKNELAPLGNLNGHCLAINRYLGGKRRAPSDTRYLGG